MDNIKKDALYWLIGLFFVVYLVARAIILPITIDEGGTYFNAVPRSVWSIITYQDPSPNNHIVNTLFIKIFVQLFGTSSLIVRLPNILGFVLYYIIAVLWLKRLNGNKIFVLFGIIVLTCNPYLLDFFGLARGYGLSLSFLFISMYQIFLYFERKQIKNIYYAFILAAIGVYCNFTLLSFYISLLSVTTLMLIQINWNSPLSAVFKKFLIIFFITGLLALLCYTPISKIVETDQLKYWSSNGFYTDTLIPLLGAMQYGNPQFEKIGLRVYAGIIIGVIILLGTYVFTKNIKQHFNLSSDILLFSFSVFIGTLVIIFLQFILFDTPFLNARGSVFLYVLFIIPVIYFTQRFYAINKKWKTAVILPFLFLGIFHFVRTLNLYNCREWWFDADTKKVLHYLDAMEGKKEISLNTYWIYNTSFQFHIQNDEWNNIELAPYHQDLQPEGNYMYYYCERAQISELEKNYVEVISFNSGNNVLMRKR